MSAGFALGIAAMLRIDVAISGAVLLVAVLVWRLWYCRRTSQCFHSQEILLAPVTAAAVALPMVVLLALQGVLNEHLHQWLSFLDLAAERSFSEMRLPPPSLHALLSFDRAAGNAWIYYSALLLILAYGLCLVLPCASRLAEPSLKRWQYRFIGLWALSGVPQFALERPDAAHLTQYACWIVLPVAILAYLAIRSAGSLGQRRGVCLGTCVIAALFVAKHVWFAEGGSIGLLRHPVQRVTLSNGFSYPAPDPAPVQKMMERIILESEATDRIATLPFFPGIAFACRRRLHDRNIFLAPHSMTDQEVESDYVQNLKAEPPRLVVYDPEFSFNARPDGRLPAFAPAVDAHLGAHFDIIERAMSLLLLEPRPSF
jgi:hypothetical protein